MDRAPDALMSAEAQAIPSSKPGATFTLCNAHFELRNPAQWIATCQRICVSIDNSRDYFLVPLVSQHL